MLLCMHDLLAQHRRRPRDLCMAVWGNFQVIYPCGMWNNVIFGYGWTRSWGRNNSHDVTRRACGSGAAMQRWRRSLICAFREYEAMRPRDPAERWLCGGLLWSRVCLTGRGEEAGVTAATATAQHTHGTACDPRRSRIRSTPAPCNRPASCARSQTRRPTHAYAPAQLNPKRIPNVHTLTEPLIVALAVRPSPPASPL